MDIQLTKDSQHALAIIYSAYNVRRSAGLSKSESIIFSDETADGKRVCAETNDSLLELKNAECIDLFITGEFVLLDKAIIYMENKSLETIKSWLSFGAQFIP